MSWTEGVQDISADEAAINEDPPGGGAESDRHLTGHMCFSSNQTRFQCKQPASGGASTLSASS